MPTSIIKVVDPYLRHVIGRDGHLHQSHVKDMGQGPTNRGGGAANNKSVTMDSGTSPTTGVHFAMESFVPYHTLKKYPPLLSAYNKLTLTQQARDIDPVLFQCWASVADAGPTLKQHWVNVSCLLGSEHTGDWGCHWTLNLCTQ